MEIKHVKSSMVWPRWIRQIQQYLSICPQFVLSGNLKDWHLVLNNEEWGFYSTEDCLWEMLRERQLEALLIYDRIDGIRGYTEECFKRAENLLNGKKPVGEPGEITTDQLTDIMRCMVGEENKDLSVALIVNYASRFTTPGVSLTEYERDLFFAWQKVADTAIELRRVSPGSLVFNPIIWLVDNPNDLPDWFAIGHDRIKGIPIELPNREVRGQAARKLVCDIPGTLDLTEEQLSAISNRFVDLTGGMTLNSLRQIRTIALERSSIDEVDRPVERHIDVETQISDAVRCYKIGVPDNPWQQTFLRDRLANGKEQIEKRVKGQEPAITKTLDILKRSVMGLSGAQASSSGGRPRGVLFFAGPTGVGKTELAKAVTELIFGDEQALIRFDMSEFGSPHSEARLLGAPPGYVGFDSGGELVNAVRRQPFCLLLFDEMEKSHKSIFDKFLQILEDGRLTDGRGRTVYFSETVIVFTSNLGMKIKDENGNVERTATKKDDYIEVDAKVRSQIEMVFSEKLDRPELLNRLGDNIVVFNFIHKPVALEIFNMMRANIEKRVRDEHGVEIEISNTVMEILQRRCVPDDDDDGDDMGARGIGNNLETSLINPLSRELFARHPKPGSKVQITGLSEDNGIVNLDICVTLES